VTEYHGSGEHHPELGHEQNKGGHLHVFIAFLCAYVYARDRLSVLRELSPSEDPSGHGCLSATARAVDMTNTSPRAAPKAMASG
jgi:hypothetical protein